MTNSAIFCSVTVIRPTVSTLSHTPSRAQCSLTFQFVPLLQVAACPAPFRSCPVAVDCAAWLHPHSKVPPTIVATMGMAMGTVAAGASSEVAAAWAEYRPPWAAAWESSAPRPTCCRTRTRPRCSVRSRRSRAASAGAAAAPAPGEYGGHHRVAYLCTARILWHEINFFLVTALPWLNRSVIKTTTCANTHPLPTTSWQQGQMVSTSWNTHAFIHRENRLVLLDCKV